jgi:hypothetical protein
MRALWWGWALTAAGALVVTVAAGLATRHRVWGVLVDGRGRLSLSRLQLMSWTIVILSLAGGVTIGRLAERGVDPLDFSIPGNLLGLLGISVSSAVVAGGVKSYKARTRPAQVGRTPAGQERLRQLVSVEEGPDTDLLVDTGKMQNLLITVLVVGAYVAAAIHQFSGRGPSAPAGPAGITGLPDLNPAFLGLLGISHVGYLGAKATPRHGEPRRERAAAAPQRRAAAATEPNHRVAGESSRERPRRIPAAARAVRYEPAPHDVSAGQPAGARIELDLRSHAGNGHGRHSAQEVLDQLSRLDPSVDPPDELTDPGPPPQTTPPYIAHAQGQDAIPVPAQGGAR